jgi:hypothetical protein
MLVHPDNSLRLHANAKREFGMVIIGNLPMLQAPKARIACHTADAAILVTGVGHMTRDVAVAANLRFAEDRTQVLGFRGSTFIDGISN